MYIERIYREREREGKRKIDLYIYIYTFVTPAHGPQTMIQKRDATGARFTCTSYRIGDLACQCSEGTEATFSLPFPTSK